MKYEIGLLKLDPESSSKKALIPSQLEGLRVGSNNIFSLGDLASWPPKSLIGQRSSSIFWNFKADLLKQNSQIKSNHSEWSALYRLATLRDGKVNISHTTSLNPHQIGEEFLAALCKSVKARVDDIFGDDVKTKFYFTAPGYSSETTQQYRDNIRAILGRINQLDELKNVEFPQKTEASTEKFLYEQYGVYYYFTHCEKKADLNKSAANYLIIDVGGSTTDVAVVHLTKTGRLSKTAFPIHESIQYGGSNLNETIIKQTINPGQLEKLTPEKRLEASYKIEDIKLNILKSQDENSSSALSLGGAVSWQISYRKIRAAFETDWLSTISPGIASILNEAEGNEQFSTKEKTFSIDGILLAGGGTKPTFFREALENDLSLNKYFSDDCNIISSEKADPSSLASIGLGISIAERRSKEFKINAGKHGELSQAEKIYYRIFDVEGNSIGIQRHKKPKDFLLSMNEVRRSRPLRTNVSHLHLAHTEFTHARRASLPEGLRLQLWTDCNSQISKLDIPLTTPSHGNGEPEPQDLYFGVTAYDSSPKKKKLDSTKLRINPYFFQWLPNKKRYARCDRGDSQKIDVSLLPEAIEEVDGEDNIYVCIDFGMTNTSIAVLAPNRYLNPQDFDILRISLPSESPVPATGETASEKPASITKEKFFQAKTNLPETVPLPTSSDSSIDKVIANDTPQDSSLKLEPVTQGNEDPNDVDIEEPPGLKPVPPISTSELANLDQTLNALTQEFRVYAQQTTATIQLLADALNQQKVSATEKTPIEPSISDIKPLPQLSVAKEAINFPGFQAYVSEKGYSYETSVLSSIWAQANNPNSRLTVLAGPPGSGKTALVRLLAEYFNQDLIEREDFNRVYLLEAVLPSWFSSENLLGFYDQIQGVFRPTTFLRFARDSEKNRDVGRTFFVCLDEFNLAQPEQYLAKVLSTIESKEKRIIVCQDPEEVIELTKNLKLFATINTDAASKTLSPKVLDRSMLIRILPTKSGIMSHAHKILKKKPGGKNEIFEFLIDELEFLFELSYSANTVFGYRTLDSVNSYISSHPFAAQEANVSRELKNSVLDSVISSYFLSKLPGLNQFGEYREFNQRLNEAKERFSNYGFENSTSAIQKIIDGFPGQSAF